MCQSDELDAGKERGLRPSAYGIKSIDSALQKLHLVLLGASNRASVGGTP